MIPAELTADDAATKKIKASTEESAVFQVEDYDSQDNQDDFPESVVQTKQAQILQKKIAPQEN